MIEIWSVPCGAENLERQELEIAALHIAAIRRFRQHNGFPPRSSATTTLNDVPAGHRTAWSHSAMPVVFDYGTDYEPVTVDEGEITQTLEQMDTTELGVIVENAVAPTSFAAAAHPDPDVAFAEELHGLG